MLLTGVLMTALAATPGADALKEEASRHFRLGVQLAGEGNYVAAAVEFKRAYDIAPQFAVLYNLGQAYVGADRPVEAVDALERYLQEGGAKIAAPRRREVDDSIREQRARIGAIDVSVQPDGASIRIDGREVGKAPLPAPVRVASGEHTVSVFAEGQRSDSRTVAVAAGDTVRVELSLVEAETTAPPEPAPAPAPAPKPEVLAPPPPEPAPAAPPPPPRSPLRLLGWGLAAGGIAALVGGGIAGALTLAPYEAEKAASMNGDVDGYWRAKGQADAAALTANILYGIGAVFAAAGIVLVLVF